MATLSETKIAIPHTHDFFVFASVGLCSFVQFCGGWKLHGFGVDLECVFSPLILYIFSSMLLTLKKRKLDK